MPKAPSQASICFLPRWIRQLRLLGKVCKAAVSSQGVVRQPTRVELLCHSLNCKHALSEVRLRDS